MASKHRATSRPESRTTRASVSFPHEIYETLELIAKEKKVSVAWIVREAAENYITEKWPLLSDRR
jgi:predicted DNA-binding protein